MLSCMKLQASKPGMKKLNKFPENKHELRSSFIRLPLLQSLPLRFSALSLKNSHFTSSVVGSPPSSSHHLTPRHITLLNVLACTVAISTTWLFCSAIPTLLAFKRAAESLEKLLDVTREELPDTMAAVRLSGMEISDLTMELSDLGQEITQGVRSSTRAVRVAEERLRRLTNMAPSASLQEVAKPKAEPTGPVVATTARNIREGIVKGRAFLQIFLTLARYSRMTINFFASRAKR